MPDIKFEIKEIVGVLSDSGKKWTKELSLVSWNDKEAKYDIRELFLSNRLNISVVLNIQFSIEENHYCAN